MRALVHAFLLFLLVATMIASPARSEGVTELIGDGPEGYRQTDFRAPVPDTLQGAVVVDAAAAHMLWEKAEAIFIDVLPRPPQPQNLKDPAKWKAPKRLNIKGSIWLPNVGFGMLHPTIDDYYRRNLEKLTRGDRTKTLVIYCQAQCWMSWNAAKRAMAYGYSQIVWFPGGTDEWEKAGFPLEEKLPQE